MIIDGRKIAEDIRDKLTENVSVSGASPRLVVFTYSPTFETKKFLGIKKKMADKIGIELSVVEFDESSNTEGCVAQIREAVDTSDGIIVQLPFPKNIDESAIISAIPKTHDVDAFNIKDEEVLPPVLGAVVEILERNDIDVCNKKCVVVGAGKLVGAPVAEWLKEAGANLTILTGKDADISDATKEAEIIILGAGHPNLLTPDMISDGVIIIDAGTSESGGKLAGDADGACAEKASLFTPVPGGVGPITVAVLFRNLLILSKRQ